MATAIYDAFHPARSVLKTLAAATAPLSPPTPPSVPLRMQTPPMPAAPQRPSTRTASMCTAAETARLTHSFKVVGSALHRGFGVGRSAHSATFAVGGHDWGIQYYPDGHAEDYKDCVAVFLELRSSNTDTEATVLYDFRLVNHATGLSSSIFTYQVVLNNANSSCGYKRFMKKSDLEALGHLKDDCLEIESDLTVIKVDEIEVPPSDLLENLGNLLQSEEGVDVTFKVRGLPGTQNRACDAVAGLQGGALWTDEDKRKRSIVVEDMQPPVIKALLHFIYTDSLPAMDDLDANEYEKMGRHLLVAADRYGMERMKLMCESILCKRLAVESVGTTLVLADDQHYCSKLKDACIRFINSSNRMNDVAASQGYENLKRACPVLTVEIWEKSAKSRKI